jgi:anti-sigma regulatory factor (Ser/Thr protein kinase)
VSLFLATYEPDLMAVGSARHAVGTALEEAGFEALADDARQVVDELVWNVVLHAGTPAVVRVSADGAAVVIEVADGNHEEPRHVHAGPEELTGRGLAIVDGLAESWGWHPVDAGKVVWVRLVPEPDRGTPRPSPTHVLA